MSDDLRSAIESAVTASDAPVAPAAPAAPAATPVAASVPAKSTVESSSSGTPPESSAPDKPAAGTISSIEEVVGNAGKAAEPAPEGETQQQREARQRVDRAPQSWKGDAKTLWAQLPLQVRQEVARREKDITQTMHSAAENKQKIDAMVSVMTPHRERILSNYGDPVRAVDSLLRTEAVLHNGSQVQKAQLVAHMVQQFGIDIRALDAALAGAPPSQETQQQSQIEQLLEQRLAPFQQFLQQQGIAEARRVEQANQQANTTVEQMAQDERYPYFNEARADMADIIELGSRRGVAISLEDAYTRAVRMNDGTFQAASVRDQSQGATQAALDAHRAAQVAKGASVSVTGSPSGGKNAGNPSDLRGTIEAAFGGGRI